MLPTASPFLSAATPVPLPHRASPWSQSGGCGELGWLDPGDGGVPTGNEVGGKPDPVYLTESTELLGGYFVLTKAVSVFKLSVNPFRICCTYFGSQSLGKLNSMYESPCFREVPE